MPSFAVPGLYCLVMTLSGLTLLSLVWHLGMLLIICLVTLVIEDWLVGLLSLLLLLQLLLHLLLCLLLRMVLLRQRRS